ncbi:hypothetical protein [Bacillus sp. SM2101]|uniref:hypothetical protein n=1 Tax=Bacillaceae TaxID=186817 RepID=UPI001BDEB19A|nr:hypothetical protein [Bacillus sp. SM2101]
MKKCLIALVTVITLVGCNNIIQSSNPVKAPYQQGVDANPSEVFADMNELAQNTPIVIVGQVKTEGKAFDYKGINFYESTIQIKDIYRDHDNSLSKGDTITLLQNDVGELDPLVKKNEKVLFFLKNYEGPVIDDAYRFMGLYQGHYKVKKDGEIVAVGSKKLEGVEGLLTSDLNAMLEDSPYVPIELDVMTAEEIEKANEEERKLKEEHDNNN